MKYRFLLTNREGASGSFEWNLESDTSARMMATEIVLGVTCVQDITIYRLLGVDSCGPIVYIATVRSSDL